MMSPKSNRAQLLRFCAGVLRPPPIRTADEWAKQCMKLPPTSPVPGRYDPSRTPYVVAIMRAFSDARYKVIVVIMGSQMGKTLLLMCVIGHRLDDDPAPIFYVGPDRDFLEDKLEPDIVSMLKGTKSLRRKTVWGRAQKKRRKVVNGAKLRLISAGSSSQLASDSVALLLVDERDRMVGKVSDEGDPVRLARARLFTYPNGKAGVISTPLEGRVLTEVDEVSGLERWAYTDPKKLASPTWRLWQQGTRFEWAWPCPHCGEFFIPRRALLQFDGKDDIATADPMKAKATAHIVCRACGCNIEDSKHKEWMNANARFYAPGGGYIVAATGEEVGDLPNTETASFWVSGLASEFVSWGDRAKDEVEAAQSADPKEVKVVVNTGFGELYAPATDAPKHSAVTDCKLPYKRGQVPYGVQRIVLTTDVQKRGVYWVMRGWGARRESWLIDYGYIAGETDGPEVWDELEDKARASLAGDTGVNLQLIDSGYRPGRPAVVPENLVYDYCRRFSRTFARPIKGLNYMTGNRWFSTTDNDVDSRGRTRKSAGLILHHLNTHEFKSRVFEKINRRKELAGGWHVPEDVDDAYAKQVVAETCQWTGGKPVWTAVGANHYLDCEMMQEAAAEILKVRLLPPLPELEVEQEPEAEEPATVPVLSEQVKVQSAAPLPPKIRQSSWRTPNMKGSRR